MTVDMTVQASLDGTWTDITADCLYQHRLGIRRGASSEASTAPPSEARFALRDDAGNSQSTAGTYDPYNPMSPHYGLWGENTPVRVYLGTPHLGEGDGSSTVGTSHVAPSVTATEAGLLCCMWLSGPGTPGNYTLPGGMTSVTERDGTFTTSRVGYESVLSGATGTRTATYSTSVEQAAASLVLHGTSLAVESAQSGVSALVNDFAHVTLTTPSDTEAGWWLVAFHGWIWDTEPGLPDAPYGDDGGWILVADSGVIESDLTGFTEYLRVRGWVKRIGQAGAQDVIFSAPPNASAAIAADSHAALIVVSGDVTDWDFRINAEVASIQHDWTVENNVRADVTAAGILRRLQQGSSPRISPPVRYYTGTMPGLPEVVAYWPLEEGPLASRGLPAVGSKSMRPFVGTHTSGAVVSYPQWGTGSLGPWLPPVVSLSSSGARSILYSRVSMSEAATEWVVDLMYASTQYAGSDTVDGVAATIDINPAYLGGAAGWPQLGFSPSTGTEGEMYVTLNAEAEVYFDTAGLYDGLGHHIRWTLEQSGANGAWTVHVDGVQVGSGTTAGAMTVPPITKIAVSVAGGPSVVIGHIAVWTIADALDLAVAPALGFPGETAARRIERLCREEGVALHIVGDPDDTEPMGPQYHDPFLEVVRACEATDAGILYEPREALALGYRTRKSLYNQPATVSAAYGDLVAPLNPAADDRFTRNDVTLTRRDGASGRSVVQDGPKGVDRVGRYDASGTVDPETDDRVEQLAAWGTHIGTVAERRYPQLSSKLHALSAATQRAIRAVDIGDRAEVTTGLPVRLQATGVDQVAFGYTEVLTSHTWDWVANTTPASQYYVFEIGDSIFGRLDTAGSALTVAYDSNDTPVSVATDSGSNPWVNSTDHASAFPFCVQASGEVVVVTAITGATSPQTFTVTRSHNGVTKSQTAGTDVRISRTAP